MATTTFPAGHGTPLSIHDCPCCGAPISLRQEAIVEALLKFAATTCNERDHDIHGDCTPLYCVACIKVLLDVDGHRAELACLESLVAGLDAALA
jgi:hypothetical protein